MTGDSHKKMVEQKGGVDRLSNLPINVTENIIGRMPIQNAARTSILSRKWRYIWVEYPELILDSKFNRETLQNVHQDLVQSIYVNTINGILFQHIGPVLKFVLSIPEFHSSRCSNIDQWLLFVSRKDVKQLILDNGMPDHYEVPSYVFRYSKIAYLSLRRCIFSTPKGVDGCRNLIRLFLASVVFEDSVILDLPQLAQLELFDCYGMDNFHVSAPSLNSLLHLENDDLDMGYYMTCKDLVHVHIGVTNGFQCHKFKLDKNFTLTKFLGCWPKLEKLYLDGPVLKHLVAGNIPQRVPINQLHSLVKVRLSYITYDWDEITCILCLLQSALNLSKLKIWTSSEITYSERTLQYLKEPDFVKDSLKRLKTVMIQYFKGSTCELLLVKLLLANSPSLERMCIDEDQDLDPVERLKISKELMQFSRASPKAVMNFEPVSEI